MEIRPISNLDILADVSQLSVSTQDIWFEVSKKNDVDKYKSYKVKIADILQPLFNQLLNCIAEINDIKQNYTKNTDFDELKDMMSQLTTSTDVLDKLYVTLDTEQTIRGKKKFVGESTEFSNDITATDITCNNIRVDQKCDSEELAANNANINSLQATDTFTTDLAAQNVAQLTAAAAYWS